MTLNELRIQCIRKTEQADDETLVADNFDVLRETDSEYKALALNVDDAINEAVNYLILNDKLPLAHLEVAVGESPISSLSKSSYPDLSKAREIRKCHFFESSGDSYAVEFSAFGGKVMMTAPVRKGTLYVFYQPMMPEIDSSTPGNTDVADLGMDETVALFVVNFAKANLYEKQEPDIAMSYRSLAMQYAAAIRVDVSLPTQRRVRRVVRL